MANKKGNNTNSRAQQRLDDSNDYSAFKVVFFYCSLIVFLPVATFFLLKSAVLDRLFTMSEITTNIYSAVGAIVALHLALGLYIYRAYFGSGQPKSESYKKID
ncbi:PREDICTED: vacuolar ATPase assembly integral membrane protein VMA21 homolog [Rhagoletis zephyria]|uniref:vacuolar ATPase assembly integral membrane protein VMA21 homolog n=1 Tax=Rhagoletis zephyria TaxID=28612 RepID=UPI00081196E6|nr:PREDICTED: vacuolar ATPase assembly integral membrane protein VMA21 homolog [Rhagoletis zephyria]